MSRRVKKSPRSTMKWRIYKDEREFQLESRIRCSRLPRQHN